MKQKLVSLVIVLVFITGSAWIISDDGWIIEKHKTYTLHYTKADDVNKKAYAAIIDDGIQSVNAFFGDTFKNSFAVFIHPNRNSLDSTWRKDWNMPDFKSECWMVASGIATKLDMISPAVWDKEACEHAYEDKLKTKQLITHELFHVYHAQLNTSADFSDAVNIDWFVEGFATYASGQCDAARIKEIKKALAANELPASLDKFWAGKLKYGLSGSVVMFIDKKYGRPKLKELLRFNNLSAILTTLNTTEATLLRDWKKFIEET